MEKPASPATFGMVRMLSVPRVNWMLWTVARLGPFLYENISVSVPRRRDHSIKKQSVHLMQQKLQSEEYCGGTCLPHPGTVHRGATQKRLHVCCLPLPARINKEGPKICHSSRRS